MVGARSLVTPPETKGKVERPFHYARKNLLNGRTFRSPEHRNEVARWWLGKVNDRRTHGTTKRSPLSEQYGKAMPGPVTKGAVYLDIRLSHQHLANIIGATRETVTITLGEMQQQGLLTIQRQRIILKDISLLAAEADAIAPIALRSPSNKSKRESSTGLLVANSSS